MFRRIGMDRRRWLVLQAAGLALMAGCDRTTPLARLEATVDQLQERLQARDARGVHELLHERFRAQGELDERWARQTMALMFQRYAQIRVVAISRSTWVDPQPSLTGFTDAQVLVTGAQGLIPERATPYTVRLQWRQVGGEWKLYDLSWE